jgi:hypothetical protein
MQREHAIRQQAKLEGYRLEKRDDDSYRLINARFNVAVYQLDGVSHGVFRETHKPNKFAGRASSLNCSWYDMPAMRRGR